MPCIEDKPSPEFLARLEAFEPTFAAVQCCKEMVQLLVVLTGAPVLVRDGMEGFLKGSYADRMYRQTIGHLWHTKENPGSQSS